MILLSYSTLCAQYKMGEVFHIQSGGGYDYTTVDSLSNNLYLSHGTQVNILNKMTGDSISVIKTDKDVHGIALAHEFGKGYISNGSSNSVLVFDLWLSKCCLHVAAGEFTDGIFLRRLLQTGRYTCNGRGKSMTVIDAS